MEPPTHHENAGGNERAPKRAQRGPHTGRGASTVGLLGDRTRIFKTEEGVGIMGTKHGLLLGGALCVLIVTATTSARTSEPVGIPPVVVADYIRSIVQTERALYTTHIVERMQDLEIVNATENWKSKGALPLPAQMLRMLGEEVRGQGAGLQIRLASLWPIYDWNGPADAFERTGLQQVADEPDKAYTGIISLAEKRFFKAIYADRAVSKACVNCHNTHTLSPKRDYKLYDVMGGIIISFPLP